MLNADFYPTPDAVIRQMLSPWLDTPNARGTYGGQPAKLRGLSILEPSAGSGNIVDFIVRQIDLVERGDYGRKKDQNIYTCEIDPDLKATLHGKGYKVLADDFLSYEGDHQFDLIILNPPFSRGCDHTLHAFAKVASGGHVVALVNSDTIRNPFTEKRQLLAKLIADHGSTEELGQVFKEAERTTAVEVTLVRLQKPVEEDAFNFSFTGNRSQDTPDLSEESFKDQLALNDVIGDMMLRQKLLKQAFVEFARARAAILFYQNGVIRRGQSVDALKIAEAAITQYGGGHMRGQYNYFSDELKQHAWSEVMLKLNIEKYMTHQVRQDFQSYSRQYGYMDFTKENVAQLVEMVLENKDTILQKAVEAVFDIFTSYYTENRCYVEGWKTNDRYKVNRKIILPRWVKWDDWTTDSDMKNYGSLFHVSSHSSSKYSDIDKIMCYLTGTNFDHCLTIEKALEAHFTKLGKVYPGEKFADTLESEFFELRFFKKGTLHMTFKNAILHQEFNLRACASKLWLPEPEMRAYQNRKRSPFAPAPEPTPEVIPEARQLVATTTAPTSAAAPLGGGLQFNLFEDATPALAQAA
jgi:hypothetical protein